MIVKIVVPTRGSLLSIAGNSRTYAVLARTLILLGVLLLAAGLILQHAPGLLGWFGRLPGDITIERGGSRVFIPITSMIIVSLLATLILNFFFRR
jgi:hypothetical protein